MNASPIAVQPLSWDSDLLGFPVARLVTAGASHAVVTAALEGARQNGIQLLYVVAGPHELEADAAVRQAGARLVDRKLTFAMSLLGHLPAETPAAIGTATEYTAQLESLAWQSGEYSRFRLDPRFDESVFRHLYSLWLRNSLTSAIARRVLVWRAPDGKELGLLTLGEKNKRADIGLLAVDASSRGQRVGQHLVAAALAQAQAWGYTELQVVTQRDNEPACRFYEKCGFALAHEEYVYHLWLD